MLQKISSYQFERHNYFNGPNYSVSS